MAEARVGPVSPVQSKWTNKTNLPQEEVTAQGIIVSASRSPPGRLLKKVLGIHLEHNVRSKN